MRGVSFPAWRTSQEHIPLIEILLVVGPWVVGAVSWRIGRNSEFATGWRGSEALARLSRQGGDLSTLALVDLVSDGIQVVDGEFYGHRGPSPELSVEIRCVRTDSWDVYSTDHEILETVTRSFNGVYEVPR